MRDRRAEHRKACTRQSLKHRVESWIANKVMRPCQAAEQSKRFVVQHREILEASTKFGTDIGRIHRVVGQPEAAAGEIAFAVARRVEVLELDGAVWRDAERRKHGIAIAAF